MTKEEVIGVLKVLASFQGVIEYLEQHSVSVQDACNMAIQALEKENIYDDKEHYVTISKALYDKFNIDYEALCEKCEVGNPCLYCEHEFEPQESEE